MPGKLYFFCFDTVWYVASWSFVALVYFGQILILIDFQASGNAEPSALKRQEFIMKLNGIESLKKYYLLTYSYLCLEKLSIDNCHIMKYSVVKSCLQRNMLIFYKVHSCKHILFRPPIYKYKVCHGKSDNFQLEMYLLSAYE